MDKPPTKRTTARRPLPKPKATPSRRTRSPRGQGGAEAAKPTSPRRGARKPRAQPTTAIVRAEGDELDPLVLGQLLPMLRALRGYTRLKVEGLAHVPREGPAILAANHTGWLGLDYALTALVLHDELGRVPRGMVHEAWFLAKPTALFAAKVGLSKVGKESMTREVQNGHLVMVFPEGEKGAFRPASGYRVEEFARGFVRVAMATNVPVIPVAILGGEEANPVDRTIESYEKLLKMRIPIPTNLWPKPVKWRIRFLPPRPFAAYSAKDADDHDTVHALSQGIRADIQEALVDLKRLRGNPYI